MTKAIIGPYRKDSLYHMYSLYDHMNVEFCSGVTDSLRRKLAQECFGFRGDMGSAMFWELLFEAVRYGDQLIGGEL